MPDSDNQPLSSMSQVGKTALYYEYTSIDVREDHVVEKTLTALQKDPDVPNESIRKVTYYLVQRFFIKSINEKKEDIDLISQIPAAFKKMVDTVPGKTHKSILIKFLNLYLRHTIASQIDQANLFTGYNKVLAGFMKKLSTLNAEDMKNSIQSKEVVIDQIYQYIDSINFSFKVTRESSKEKARKKIDLWINRIFENHVIAGAIDVITALEDYCLEEVELTRKRIDFLKKYQKINVDKITKEITENPEIKSIDDAWPVFSENIFIYIDNLSREHGDYKKFLEEILYPIDENFVEYFFSHFFLISAIQKQTEKDIYLVEKTFKDLHLELPYKRYFTSRIHSKIEEGQEKAYYIENYFQKNIMEIKGPHKNAFAYLTLKYLLEQTLDESKIKDDLEIDWRPLLKKAFTDFIRPKYPKFLDSLIFIFLKQSRDLERKVGNTKKSYSNIYQKDITLLKNVFASMGLLDDYNRTILPCITGFEQSNQILKRQ